MAAMALVGCTKKTSSSVEPSSEAPISESATPSSVAPSSVTPASSSQTPTPSSQEQSSSQEAGDPAYTVTKVDVVLRDQKVYAQVYATTENIAATQKWAVGVKQGDAWLKGSAEPAEADYNVSPVVSGQGGYIEVCVSDLTGVEAGTLLIYVGVNADTYKQVIPPEDSQTVKLGSFKYHASNFYQGITVDELPPFELTEASVIEKDGKAWARIGGATTVTPEIAATYTPFINFQTVGGSWGNYGHDNQENPVNIPFQWDFSTTGKGYLLVDVSFMTSGSDYNTHINMLKKVKADMKMEVDIDKTYSVLGKNYRVYSNTKGTQQSDFWGNLAFRVSDDPLYVRKDYQSEAVVSGQNSAGKAIAQYSTEDGSASKIAIAVNNYTSKTGNIDATGKMDKGAELKWNVQVDKAIKNAKLIFQVTATSPDHLNRHFYNEAIEDAKHKDEEGYVKQNTGGTPDKDTEDPWRYEVAVGGTVADIINMRTLGENGCTQNVPTKVVFANIDLAAGDNEISLKQCNIGYRFLFTGDMEIQYTGNAKLVTGAVAHSHEFGSASVIAGGEGEVSYNKSTCACGAEKIDFKSLDGTFASGSSNKGGTPEGYLKLNSNGNSISYKFTYGAAVTAKIYFDGKMDSMPGNASKGFFNDSNLTANPNFTLTVNDTNVNIDDKKGVSYADMGVEQDGTTSYSKDLVIEVGEISLVNGQNTITFTRNGSYNYLVKNFVIIIEK